MMGVDAIHPTISGVCAQKRKKFVLKAQPRRILYRRKK
jgi:hypothetical protein